MATRLSSLKRRWMRFARREDGAAALELAMIAGPFFLMLVALAEVALMAYAQTTLDFAVSESARAVRTGQVQTLGLSADDMKDDVCARLNQLLPMECASNLFVDVDTFADFNAADNPVPIVGGQVDEDQIDFSPGDPGDVVMVRGYYRWEVITPFFQSIFGNVNGTDRLLVSTSLFRNEPFPDPTP